MGLWSDERSRAEYVAQVRGRLTACFDTLASAETSRVYFPPDLVQFTGDDTYVDAGAFDGDSLESFVEAASGRFRLAVAYEPDPDNFSSLLARIGGRLAAYRSRVSARRQAVADAPGIVSFLTRQGMSSRPGANGLQVPAITLDSLLEEGIVPTYMKFDVEGFEPAALAGAKRVIGSHSPTLSVCVYHRQEHLWTLPLAIHAMNSRYCYYLRPYGFVWDEVCYAIPRAERLG